MEKHFTVTVKGKAVSLPALRCSITDIGGETRIDVHPAENMIDVKISSIYPDQSHEEVLRAWRAAKT